MISNLGNTTEEPLLPGEKVAVRTRRVLSRKGRCVVRVRIYGSASLGWLDSFMLWGACVEVFVCHGGNVKHLVESLYPDVYVAPLAKATKLPPHRPPWDGVLATTISSDEEAKELYALAELWRPTVILIATHKHVSRKKFDSWLPFVNLQYGHMLRHLCHHNEFGGVTSSVWRMAIGIRSRDSTLDLSLPRMTAGLYARHLQTALDDTVGPAPGKRRLEMNERVGSTSNLVLPVGFTEKKQPVYDSAGLAPDVALYSPSERHSFWVLAVSVFSKSKVLRRVSVLEWLAVWDYAGKIWYQGMSTGQQEELLRARFQSPPGKILKTFVFGLCQQILEHSLPDHCKPRMVLEGHYSKL